MKAIKNKVFFIFYGSFFIGFYIESFRFFTKGFLLLKIRIVSVRKRWELTKH